MNQRTDDIEQVLHRAGERWRADQPPALEPDLPLPERSRRQRLIPLIASAAAVLAVVAGALAVRTVADHRPDRPATGPASLILHDGDTAEASGIVIATAGHPVQFCPTLPIADIGRQTTPPTCGGFQIIVTGVDLDRLPYRKVVGDMITGSALLRGIYRDGALHVTSQGAPVPPTARGLPDVLKTTPCEPPAGGWKGNPDPDAIGAYLDAHADRLNGMGINYPTSAVWDPKNIDYSTSVVVVGVSSGDVDQAQAELRARFGGNICAVPVAFSAAEQARVEKTVGQMSKIPRNGIYGTGSGIFGSVPVQVTVLTQSRFDALSKVGLDELSLDVWLKPVR
ncbi:MAG TPA: hypothetical protein VEL02_05205 [Jatrophihabitantaceae bacterium]|nr:hypothetical protein [Jatrophihabitantaceae bacterium]